MSSASDVAVLDGDALPLYYRIKTVLEERIRSGVLEPGSQLPSATANDGRRQAAHAG